MKTKIGTWKGNPIESLEKNELLEVIQFLSGELSGIKEERDFLGDNYYDLLTKKKLFNL